MKGVSDLINDQGVVNVDFADVRTIMSNKGVALMGVIRNYQTYRVGHPGNRVPNGIPRELDGTSKSWTPGCRLSPGYLSPGVAFIGYVGREVWCGGHRLGHT